MYALIRTINLFKIHSKKNKSEKKRPIFYLKYIKMFAVGMTEINRKHSTWRTCHWWLFCVLYICVLVANLRLRDKFILSSRSKNWNDKWINRKNIIKLVLFTPFILWQYFESRDPVLNFNWSSVSVPCATREAQ